MCTADQPSERDAIRKQVLGFLGDDHLAYDLDRLVTAYAAALQSCQQIDLAQLATQYELPEEPDR